MQSWSYEFTRLNDDEDTQKQLDERVYRIKGAEAFLKCSPAKEYFRSRCVEDFDTKQRVNRTRRNKLI